MVAETRPLTTMLMRIAKWEKERVNSDGGGLREKGTGRKIQCGECRVQP